MGLTENSKKISLRNCRFWITEMYIPDWLMQPQRERGAGSSSLPEPGAVGPGCQSRVPAPPTEDGVPWTPLPWNYGLLHFPSISLDGLPAGWKGLHCHVARPLSCQDAPPPPTLASDPSSRTLPHSVPPSPKGGSAPGPCRPKGSLTFS